MAGGTNAFFEAELRDGLKKLPDFARFGEFARVIPQDVEVDATGVTLSYSDGSRINWDPIDIWRSGRVVGEVHRGSSMMMPAQQR